MKTEIQQALHWKPKRGRGGGWGWETSTSCLFETCHRTFRCMVFKLWKPHEHKFYFFIERKWGSIWFETYDGCSGHFWLVYANVRTKSAMRSFGLWSDTVTVERCAHCAVLIRHFGRNQQDGLVFLWVRLVVFLTTDRKKYTLNEKSDRLWTHSW